MKPPDIQLVELSELPCSNTIFQSSFWGLLKANFEWKSYSFNFNGTALLVLVRKIFGKYSIAYIPHGPELLFKDQVDTNLQNIGLEIKKMIPSSCFTIRFDLPAGIYTEDHGLLTMGSKLKKSAIDIQPPDTVIISLKETEDDILGKMKSKTRYNIRLSFRKGVIVEKAGIEALNEWYSLYKETALRDKMTIHSKAYYRKIFELSGNKHPSKKTPKIVLLKAVYNNQLLAGIIIAIYGNRATYLYGASSNEYRNFMPAYALQWVAIKYAKEKKCTEYDLFGIPPKNNSNHPMNGLYQFKTGFGGRILHRPGCWDLPLKPAIYMVYRWAEYVRLLYYKKLRKKLFKT